MLRVLVAGVLLLWAVMTLLLLRVTYFPDGTSFSEVPPSYVMKMFLDQTKSTGTWRLYNGNKDLGPIRVDARRSDGVQRVIQISGEVNEGHFDQFKGRLVWRINLTAQELSSITAVSGQIRIAEEGKVLDFSWKPGDRMPKFELKEHGLTLMNDQLAGPMIGQFMGGSNPTDFAQAQGIPQDIGGLFSFRAREGSMTLSGQPRRGYVMEMKLMEQWKAKAFFTEVGELAMVDLPQGYRVIEQVIYNLAPEYPDEEEEPL